MVPYVGSVVDVLTQFTGGLRNSLGYNGSRNMQDFHEKVEFRMITGAGLRENHPHDVQLYKDAPNYKGVYEGN